VSVSAGDVSPVELSQCRRSTSSPGVNWVVPPPTASTRPAMSTPKPTQATMAIAAIRVDEDKSGSCRTDPQTSRAGSFGRASYCAERKP
jgi:hypothetical protein